ncbi:MAG: cell division protein FtsA [Sphingomonadaceae bacterium]|uniref:cell division protein FtsA n=1 Tax=Thermaurantiacus sp. TaxID=2820283 RepID=UPI00298EF6AF|nr:cell division protein FtsA [Thermaurantiacus sp.]MCS6986923.1 cell division protein FtsA [Sphingomonadaceae bacterium]MDW8415477.1 cell division protein FtsA [Thermaurantiacus sp.]
MAVAAMAPGGLLRARAQEVVAALDVGTSKVAALIAALEPDGPPQVLGCGVRASAGLRRGLVADMARTEEAIRAAMMQAERAAGIEVESVLVSVSGAGLGSEVTSVTIDIAGHRITEADMERLLLAGREEVEARVRATGRTALHAEPALYVVDGLDGVADPVGFHARQLAVDIHVVSADTPPCRNLDLAVRNAHLDVDGIVAGPVAASAAVLAPEEAELGVAVVEIGAGVTGIAVHGGGVLAGLASVPMGAGDITADIARAFATPRAAAEKLKTLHGAATAAPRDNHDLVDIPPIDPDDGPEVRRVPKAELVAVIRTRLDLLFREVDDQLAALGFRGPAGRQVVLTGGGAELRGIAEFAASALGRSVRIGRPRGLAGLPEAQSGPAGATLAGLVLRAARPAIDLGRIRPRPRGTVGAPAGTAWSRLVEILKRQF